MPRYNVEYKGKWACFTSIVDGFITEFMEKDEYEQWRKEEYGLKDYEPAEKRNMMTMEKAVSYIRLNRNHDDALECILESGLPEEESEKLLYDLETTHYVPIPKKDGKYECPNCHVEVEKDQVECENDTCCLDFVWR